MSHQTVPVPELEHALGEGQILARVADVCEFPVAQGDQSVIAPDLLADPVLTLAQTHARRALRQVVRKPVQRFGHDRQRRRAHALPNPPPSLELESRCILG